MERSVIQGPGKAAALTLMMGSQANGGRGYTAEPDVLIEQLKGDEATAEADTLLLTMPNQLDVDYNAHVIEAILKHAAPGLGWR